MPTVLPGDDELVLLKSLRPKVRRFCYQYVIDLNGAQAAIRAGYTPHTAHVRASQLLANTTVRSAVDSLIKKDEAELQLTGERVKREVARISYVDPQAFFDDHGNIKKPKDWPRQWCGAVASYNARKKEITFHSKVPALALASRITRVIEGDAVPLHLQQNFVVICPSDAAPEQWQQMAAVQVTQMIESTPSTPVTSNGHPPHGSPSHADTSSTG